MKKKSQFRQGEGRPFRADVGYIQHLKDKRTPEQRERDEEKSAALAQAAEASIKQKDMKQKKHEAVREARQEKKHDPNFHPGGPAQSASAAEARAAMIKRHAEPGKE